MKQLLADVLKKYRAEKQITQWALGQQCDIFPQTISDIEAGRHEPSFGKARNLARVIHFDLADIILLSELKKEPC